jgi:hypothetical protein
MTTRDYLTHPFVPPDTIHVFGTSGERQIEPETAWGPGHQLALSNFHDAIETGAPLAASGEDGALVLEAVVGAYASGALGCEVPLPLSPNDPVYQRGAAGIAELAVSDRSSVRRRGLFGVPSNPSA